MMSFSGLCSRPTPVFANTGAIWTPSSPGRAHFGHQPINQELTRTRAAVVRMDDQICQIAGGSDERRVLLNCVIGDANDLTFDLFGHDCVNGSVVIHDSRPRASSNGFGRLSVIETAVGVPKIAPARFVACFDPAYSKFLAVWSRHGLHPTTRSTRGAAMAK